MNLLPVLSILLAVLLPFPSSESVAQTVPSSWSSIELDGLLAKSPCLGDCERQPIKVANSLNIQGVGMHMPETKTGIAQLVSRSGNSWTSVLNSVGEPGVSCRMW